MAGAEPGSHPGSPAPVSWRVGTIAVLLAVIATGCSITTRSPGPGSRGLPQDGPGTDRFSAGLYRHTKSTGTELVRFQYSTRFVIQFAKLREIWIAPDGSGRIRELLGKPEFLTQADRTAWLSSGSPLPPTVNRDFAPGGLTFIDLSRLPRNPTALVAFIRSRARLDHEPTSYDIFNQTVDYLRETVPDQSLARLLYSVLSTEPGVDRTLNARDSIGRFGTALRMSGSVSGLAQTTDLVFDPGTFQLLEERRELLQVPPELGEYQAPIELVRRDYLEADLVSQLH